MNLSFSMGTLACDVTDGLWLVVLSFDFGLMGLFGCEGCGVAIGFSGVLWAGCSPGRSGSSLSA